MGQSSRVLCVLAATLLLLPTIASNTAAQGPVGDPDLGVRIIPLQAEFALDEPIAFRIVFSNTSGKPLQIHEPDDCRNLSKSKSSRRRSKSG